MTQKIFLLKLLITAHAHLLPLRLVKPRFNRGKALFKPSSVISCDKRGKIMSDQFLWNLGVTLIVLGFAISFIAVLSLVFSGARGGRGKVKGGGAVIIGPIPIIFGTDKESVKFILVLSIILVVLLLILTVFWSNFFG